MSFESHNSPVSRMPSSEVAMPEPSSTIESSSAMDLTPTLPATYVKIKTETLKCDVAAIIGPDSMNADVDPCPCSCGSNNSLDCHSCGNPEVHCEESDPSRSYIAFRCLDTLSAQRKFSQRLDQLLLQVLLDREADSNSSLYEESISSVSNCTTSASSSLYAADVSADVSTNTSRSCSTASTSSKSSSYASDTKSDSASISSHSIFAAPSDSSLHSARTSLAAQLIYGSVSDRSMDTVPNMDCTSTLQPNVRDPEPPLDQDTPKPTTPFSAADLVVPPAPKKMQHNVYPSHAEKGSSTPNMRKRSRVSSFADLPEQDHLKPGECMLVSASRNGPTSTKKYAYSRIPILQTKRTNPGEVVVKKRRLSPFSDGPKALATSVRPKFFATEPASLRRAASLRSETSKTCLQAPTSQQALDMNGTKHARNPCTTVEKPTGSFDGPSRPFPIDCVPTEPASPVTPRPPLASTSSPPIPVLSPSTFGPCTRAPLTLVDVAECRLQILIEKELKERQADGLPVPVLDKQRPSSTRDGSDDQLWHAFSDRSSPTVVDEQSRPSRSNANAPGAVPPLGVQESFRMKIVDWILEVNPPKPASKPNVCANLRSQLSDSPDTRWLAAHLFTRYFLRVGTSPSSSPIPETSKKPANGPRVLTGREALTWDIAVACMSLAVKFHRDFLPPLYPVIANEYLLLAPHTMEYEDLEAAHRDVLGAFSHCIVGYTPAAYLDEIFNALPSLRTLTDTHGDREYASSETWEILYDSLIDITYLRYPVYLVTGCALILGITESVIFKRKIDAAMKAKYGAEPATKRRRVTKCECENYQAKARKVVQGAGLDVRELLGVAEESWSECMEWLEGLLDV